MDGQLIELKEDNLILVFTKDGNICQTTSYERLREIYKIERAKEIFSSPKTKWIKDSSE